MYDRNELIRKLSELDRRGIHVLARRDIGKLFPNEREKAMEKSLQRMVSDGLLQRAAKALDGEGMLKDLVFQGGAALRLCRGSARFSEDLDFAGGVDFTAGKMARIKACVEKSIGDRFGLTVKANPKSARVRASLPLKIRPCPAKKSSWRLPTRRLVPVNWSHCWPTTML